MELNRNTNAANILKNDIQIVTKSTVNELEFLSGKKILFTGGAGFLGYLFLHVLSEIGNNDGRKPVRLIIFENFIRGKKKWFEDLTKKSNVSLIEHDVTMPLPENLPDFDYIIHAASIASPTFYRKYPIETIDANVNGLRNLLDYARRRADSGDPILGMLFFSTSEIYGDPSPNAIPTPETYRGFVSCTGPRACYDESKRLGETLCVNFAQKYEVPVAIARPFNNYGPGLSIQDRRILPDLALNLFEGKDLILLSDGRSTRTFCYIADAISGYIQVLVKGRSGEPYNIGTDTPEISMKDLAEKVVVIGSEFFDYSGKVFFEQSSEKDYLVDNPNRRCPDITKARKELGYEPRVTLDEGLQKSLLWYKENSI